MMRQLLLASILGIACGMAQAQVKSAKEILQALHPDDDGQTRQIADTPTISLTVTFELGSFKLTPDGMAQLDELARALQSPDLGQKHYLLAGHTDAQGNAGYNLKLSARRAQAAKSYLVQHYHIAANRLDTRGMGSTQLLDAAHPNDASNRRVEVTEVQ